MKIHGSMPDQVQIRSFLTIGGPTFDPMNGTARLKGGLSDMTMTPQPNRYSTVKSDPSTAGHAFDNQSEEAKAGTPGVSKELKDILEDL